MPTFNIDAQIVNPEAACISVMDHGLLYGDGVFEGLRFYDHHIFAATEHLVRLNASAKAIGLTLPLTDRVMLQSMRDTIEASGLTDGYVRLVVTRGAGLLGIDPASCNNPKTIIIVDELSLVPKAIVQKGIKVIIASIKRFDRDQLDPRIKSLNYLNQILARQQATAAGAHEALLLNKDGRLAEGSADNIFVVKNGCIKTPAIKEGALDGITRKTILRLCHDHKISASEGQITVAELLDSDECFLTGTGAELIPVADVDGKPYANKRPVFERLQRSFSNFVREQRDDTSIPE